MCVSFHFTSGWCYFAFTSGQSLDLQLAAYFHSSLRPILKNFEIHVFFTPAYDFTSVYLTGVKLDRSKLSLHFFRVTNIWSLWKDRSVFTSLHFGEVKWKHTCNNPPLRGNLTKLAVGARRLWSKWVWRLNDFYWVLIWLIFWIMQKSNILGEFCPFFSQNLKKKKL